MVGFDVFHDLLIGRSRAKKSFARVFVICFRRFKFKFQRLLKKIIVRIRTISCGSGKASLVFFNDMCVTFKELSRKRTLNKYIEWHKAKNLIFALNFSSSVVVL